MSTSSSSDVVTPPKRQSRFKRLLVNLSVSCISLIIFVGLLELALRLMGYGNVEIYEADPLLYWRLKPDQNCYTKVNHQPVHINSQGTRGPEFQPAKPSNTLRIVSLGDSRTFGWGLSDAETYSRVLETLLQQQLGPARKVEVINAGVNAWSFPQMTAFFRERALPYHPDYVVVGDANLWTQFSEKNSPEFVRKFMLRVRLKNLLRRLALYHYFVEVKLSDVYQRYRVKFVPVDPAQDTLFKEQQQKDPDAFFRNAIEQLCTVALSNRVVPILMYLPTQDETNRPMQKNLRAAKEQLARKFNVPFLDLSPGLKETGKALYLDADPVHFNADGNQIIGRRLFDTVTNLVSR
jgi:lysophospholipase L1-like esterase